MHKRIKVGDKYIGENDPVFVIAEIGSNHNQDINTAKKLIDLAVKAGANAVKFQTFSANKLFSTKSNIVNNVDALSLFKSLELDRNWHNDLFQYCGDNNIEFMSTPFDEDAVDELFGLGVKRFKVSGFESTDLRFIKYVASTKLPIIISMGIGTDMGFIQKILDVCDEVGCSDITLLHCNNGYPTPVEDTKLLTIRKIIDTYPVKVGLSDHTEDVLTPSLAVALGARVVEKHFTLSKHLIGPDHHFALEPHELSEMIENIRHTEKTLFIKNEISESEKKNFQGQRSLVLKKKVKVGDRVTSSNVTTKRPYYSTSIHAREYFNLVDKKFIFKNSLTKDEFLTLEDIEEK